VTQGIDWDMTLILYELGSRSGLRYSQFAWRSHLALAHKGLQAVSRAVRISDKSAIAFSHQTRVPILVADDLVVPDSWKIAEHLEDTYSDAPSLFGGEIGRSTSKFVNFWVDRQLIPVVVPFLMIDVVRLVSNDDAAHLRHQIEAAFRRSLEMLAENRDRDVAGFRKLLDPARQLVRSQNFLSGSSPAYPDYILFSLFQWSRIVSSFELLDSSDVLWNWRERMLDLHGGIARKEPRAATFQESKGHEGR
jgi:glutathione S-transferase